MLVLLFIALWFILRVDLFYILPCFILFVCFSVLLVLRLPLLGEERANLSAFRTFVRFVLVWICRFPLPLGVWEGLRFVIVALPGLFSYLFFHTVNIPVHIGSAVTQRRHMLDRRNVTTKKIRINLYREM